jgi:hypothetical protein
VTALLNPRTGNLIGFKMGFNTGPEDTGGAVELVPAVEPEVVEVAGVWSVAM